MPVEVELNGLLPGRGPGRGAPDRCPWACPPPPGGVEGTEGTGLVPPGTGPGLGWPGTGRLAGPGTPRGALGSGALGTGPRADRSPPSSAGLIWAGSGWLNGTCGTDEGAARLSSARGGSAG